MTALTSAERQDRRREQYRRMRDALKRIAIAGTVKEARAIAATALEMHHAAPAAASTST